MSACTQHDVYAISSKSIKGKKTMQKRSDNR